MVEVSLGIALFSMIFGSSVIFMLKMQEMYQQMTKTKSTPKKTSGKRIHPAIQNMC